MNLFPASMHKKKLALFLLLSVCPGISLGHIKNEATQFPDIEYSPARFDIVALVGLGIIPETPVFEPDSKLSKSDLAVWGALLQGLSQGGETPNVATLASLALEEGLIETLEGEATVAELDKLFPGTKAEAMEETQSITKAEAASRIAAGMGTDEGQYLLDDRGLRLGPTGEITSVDTQQGHHGGHSYLVTIDGQVLALDEHGRVANGPTDVLQWVGRKVQRSIIRGSADRERVIYLEAEKPAIVPAQDAQVTSVDVVDPAQENDRKILYILILLVVVMGVVLFFNRRKPSI